MILLSVSTDLFFKESGHKSRIYGTRRAIPRYFHRFSTKIVVILQMPYFCLIKNKAFMASLAVGAKNFARKWLIQALKRILTIAKIAIFSKKLILSSHISII